MFLLPLSYGHKASWYSTETPSFAVSFFIYFCVCEFDMTEKFKKTQQAKTLKPPFPLFLLHPYLSLHGDFVLVNLTELTVVESALIL